MWPESGHGSGCRKDGNPYGSLWPKCLSPPNICMIEFHCQVLLVGDLRPLKMIDSCRQNCYGKGLVTHKRGPRDPPAFYHKTDVIYEQGSVFAADTQSSGAFALDSQQPSGAVGKYLNTILSASQLMCIEKAPKGLFLGLQSTSSRDYSGKSSFLFF